MGADIGAPIGGSANSGFHFLLEELGGVERIIKRGHTTASHDLDLACTLHELLAGTAQHLVTPVGDGCDACPFSVVGGIAGHARQGIQQAEVAVTRSLGNHCAGRENAGAGHNSAIYRHLQPEDRTTCVADGREATHQGGAGFLACNEMNERYVLGHGS